MKMLFVSHEKNRNGSTVSMITLIAMLMQEYNFVVHVLIPGHGEAEKELQKHNISYKILNYHPDFRKINNRKFLQECVKECINEMAVLKIKKILRKENYDYVCSNSSAVDVAARAARACKVPHIYYIREFMEEDFCLEYRNKKRMRVLLEASEKVIFISKAIQKKYTGIYNIKNYKTFYDGIDVTQYYINNHKILQNKCLELIQVGSFSDGKGTMQIVEFINTVRKMVNCRLTLMGYSNDKYLEMLKKYIIRHDLERNVLIIPYTVDVREALKDKDIMIVNSCSEGFGRVTIEGMLGGLLVLGRNAAGTSEIVEHNKTGILFQNLNEFCQCLCDINNNRNVYRKIALSGQKMACEKYQPLNTTANFVKYLEG